MGGVFQFIEDHLRCQGDGSGNGRREFGAVLIDTDSFGADQDELLGHLLGVEMLAQEEDLGEGEGMKGHGGSPNGEDVLQGETAAGAWFTTEL